MVAIASSTSSESAQEADGRRWVHERHTLSDGRVLTFDWLGDQPAEPVIAQRAAVIAQQLAQDAAAMEQVAGTRIPLYRLQFRRRFTREEREAIDEFERTFEDRDDLTAEQKRSILTYFKDYAEASEIRLDDPDTIGGVQLFAALGLLTPQRAAEVLNG